MRLEPSSTNLSDIQSRSVGSSSRPSRHWHRMGIDPVAGHRKRVFPLQLVVHSQGLVCVVRESKPGLALLEVAARPETLRSRLWLQILRSV